MKKELKEKLCEQVEDRIEQISNEGINVDNIMMLDKLVDIHKDVKNEEYWEEKIMRYRTGGSYREGNSYRDGNSYRGDYPMYGARRRDSRGRYMGDGEPMEEMYNHYGNYVEGKREYSRGNYGAKEDTMKSLEYMLESMVDFVDMLKNDANSEEEIEMIRKYARKVADNV